MNDFNAADSQGRAEGIIRQGTIAEVDNGKRKVKVTSGGLTSGWLPQPAAIGNNFISWTPMRVGTQVMLGCPSGDFAQAAIIQVLYTDALNSPSTDADTDVIQFNDGTVIKKDGGSLVIDTPCKTTITTPTLTINANVAINGGSLTHNGTNVGDTHTHDGIVPGPKKTGAPS